MSVCGRKVVFGIGLVVAGCSVVFGCAKPVERDLLTEAEAFCLDQKYGDALPLLNELLIEEPANAGAHYYRGRCFMLGDDFRPRIAVGEFQIALRLFKEQGGESPIDRFLPRYFELMCNVDSAKATIFEVQNLVEKGIAPEYVRPVFERGERFVEAARAVWPDAEEVSRVSQFLSAMSYEHSRSGRQSRNSSTRSF